MGGGGGGGGGDCRGTGSGTSTWTCTGTCMRCRCSHDDQKARKLQRRKLKCARLKHIKCARQTKVTRGLMTRKQAKVRAHN